jgi:hypothetical protein
MLAFASLVVVGVTGVVSFRLGISSHVCALLIVLTATCIGNAG